MKIEEFCGKKILIIEDGDDIKVTVPNKLGRTCIYLTGRDGRVDITGGANVIGKISGEGMLEKVEKEEE